MDGTRRRLLLLAAGLAALPARALASHEGSPNRLTLWPDGPPGGGGPDGPPLVGARGAVSNVAIPALEVYRAAKPGGMAVLIAAGGGYKRIELEKEARPAARWLAARGIAAFVLVYRLPGEGWTAGPLAPLQDAQRALRLLAARAGDFGFDARRIGVLGFSAGGHLMGLAAARSSFASYRPVDAIDARSARPSQAALVYPVVTLLPPYDHTSTRVELVGRHPARARSAQWSVQTHVGPDCPPLFLVQAQDDPISDIANTAILAQAAAAAGVPWERHVLPSGGHGFAMGRAGTPSAQWPGWYEAWLRRR